MVGFADPPSASQPMQRDGMDIPPNIRTEGQDGGEAIVAGGRWLGDSVVPDRVGRGS